MYHDRTNLTDNTINTDAITNLIDCAYRHPDIQEVNTEKNNKYPDQSIEIQNLRNMKSVITLLIMIFTTVVTLEERQSFKNQPLNFPTLCSF